MIDLAQVIRKLHQRKEVIVSKLRDMNGSGVNYELLEMPLARSMWCLMQMEGEKEKGTPVSNHSEKLDS